jgi:hypothetical protein
MSEVANSESGKRIHDRFEDLVATESVLAEQQAASEAIERLSPSAVALRETELMAAYQDVVRDQPHNEARRQEISKEMHELDYMGRKYFYRAGMRKYEMEQHPEQLWLDMADTEKIAPVKEMVEQTPRLLSQHVVASIPDVSGWPAISLDGDRTHSLAIPCVNMVYAEGFESWETGRGGTKMSDDGDTISSKEVIDNYAARETKIPPIDALGFIQPNGIIVYAVRDGAHRAAAALQRGEEYIEAQHLRLVRVDYNLVESAIAE